MDSLPPELWYIILKDLHSETIINVCTTSKSLFELRECKDLWIALLTKHYIFIDLNNLPKKKCLLALTYYDLYVAIHNDLNRRANYLFDHYALCDKTFIRKDLMIKEVIKCIVIMLSMPYIDKGREMDTDIVFGTPADILTVMSGLNTYYMSYDYISIDYFGDKKLYVSEVTNYLLSTLKDYCIKVKEVATDD